MRDAWFTTMEEPMAMQRTPPGRQKGQLLQGRPKGPVIAPVVVTLQGARREAHKRAEELLGRVSRELSEPEKRRSK